MVEERMIPSPRASPGPPSIRVIAARAGAWLSRTLPGAHRALLPVGRLVRRLVPTLTYWGERKNMRYYRAVVEIARRYVPDGRSVIDVGAADTRLVDDLTWFTRRVVLDRSPMPSRPGIEHVLADFMDYEPSTRFDLVVCLQVLEHLDDPAPFARKLLGLGTTVVVSVPYRWPTGLQRDHVQDPVDEAKLACWIPAIPLETLVVKNGHERLVAVYGSDRGSRPGPM